MIKKNLALTVLANVDLLTKVTMNLSPVDIARLMLISCKELRKVPVLDLILKLTSTTPYHHQELLLYDSYMKAHSDTTEKCDSILEKAHLDLLDLVHGDEHLSSDKQREFIRLYHLSSSPLCKLKHSHLANNIQSYINTKLGTKKMALFGKLEENAVRPEDNDGANTETITDMITKNPILVFAKYEYGYTPLHLAAESKNSDTVKALLKAGAEVNATVTAGLYKDCTPLHLAAKEGNSDTVKVLISAGADVNATITDGYWKDYTPLHLAAIKGQTKIVEALIEAGADVNATVTDGIWKGWTPLDLAKNDAIKALLLEAGATE